MRFPGLPKRMLLSGGKEGGGGAGAFSRPFQRILLAAVGLKAGKGGMHFAGEWEGGCMGKRGTAFSRASKTHFACRILQAGVGERGGGLRLPGLLACLRSSCLLKCSLPNCFQQQRKRQLFNRLWPGRIVQLRGGGCYNYILGFGLCSYDGGVINLQGQHYPPTPLFGYPDS